VSPFIRTIRTGAIYGSYAALHAIHSYSLECVEGVFSEVPKRNVPNSPAQMEDTPFSYGVLRSLVCIGSEVYRLSFSAR